MKGNDYDALAAYELFLHVSFPVDRLDRLSGDREPVLFARRVDASFLIHGQMRIP